MTGEPGAVTVTALTGDSSGPESGLDQRSAANGVIATMQARLFPCPLSELIAVLEEDPRLERAWRVIELNYQEAGLRLDRAAKLAGISKTRLNVLLQRAIGMTFHQLLTRYRLFQAVNGIALDDSGLLDLALKVGFGSVRTLERNFLKAFGAAPRTLKIFRAC
ncbi:MAG TPA: helix-turn-helix domain-containing protein [Blastocatellia bacterium]|nr:helix-turn-helix domain-containing protein [Blastocatellia bacterium]